LASNRSSGLTMGYSSRNRVHSVRELSRWLRTICLIFNRTIYMVCNENSLFKEIEMNAIKKSIASTKRFVNKHRFGIGITAGLGLGLALN
jgi:hypothetical protein